MTAILLDSLFKIRRGLIFCGSGSQHTMGREFNIPWVLKSIYQDLVIF